MVTIYKILIANRGEIACRIIRTCNRLGISTVAVYSDSDENAPFVKMADEAHYIGDSVAAQSYLNGQRIIHTALISGSNAIHPGYGFLSENADFADQVTQAGLIFIGPKADSIRTIGDKSAAKEFITRYAIDIPLIPGYHDEDQTMERLENEAKKIEFPVLLKASAGGGGKGMRAVYNTEKLQEEIEAAKGESLRSFGCDKLLIEKYFESVRHVEVQIFGDQYGNVYHINERDCSIQRRHQKIIEETPSPAVDKVLRKSMTSAAVELGRQLGYEGAGTVEFILDESTKKFYFLELNTRLQVEHPITEAISGLDLVEIQIMVAQGANLKTLGILDNIKFNGHAIECRLCAEDPDTDFGPRTGVIRKWSTVDAARRLPGVRYDTGVEDGSSISIFYDSMIAKIIVHAPTRTEAIQSMITTLSRTVVLGVTTNQKFLLSIMNNALFQGGIFDTKFISNEANALFPPLSNTFYPSAVAALMYDWVCRKEEKSILRNIPPRWRNVQVKKPHMMFMVNNQQEAKIEYDYLGEQEKRHRFQCNVSLTKDTTEPQMLDVVLFETDMEKEIPGPSGIQGTKGLVRLAINGVQKYFYVATEVRDVNERSIFIHDFSEGHQTELVKVDRLKSAVSATEDDKVTPYTSSMPCRILKILAPTGTLVQKNVPLLSVESMKTEIKILSRHVGKVTMRVEENQLVDARVLLCHIDEV
ncbi:carbamoyl-phosphate synthase L chain, ATP binding domain-containing protein [Phycomyces nitens]|nr:carbamoyl-phosphate synthase L chain, ATP binding domain-containing protein [Phycomyces nitens]